jgi:hypothetical protein
MVFALVWSTDVKDVVDAGGGGSTKIYQAKVLT